MLKDSTDWLESRRKVEPLIKEANERMDAMTEITYTVEALKKQNNELKVGHVGTHTHTHTHAHTYTHVQTCEQTCTSTQTQTPTHICTYLITHTYRQMSALACTLAHNNIHTRTSTHTQTYKVHTQIAKQTQMARQSHQIYLDYRNFLTTDLGLKYWDENEKYFFSIKCCLSTTTS